MTDNYKYFNPYKDGETGSPTKYVALDIEVENVRWTPQELLDQGCEFQQDEYFNAVRELALDNGEAIVEHWLPGGELQGREYKAYNPHRRDTCLGSFSISLEKGVWADFATDDKGGDLISLVKYVDKLEFYSDAARQVLKFLVGQTESTKAQLARIKAAEKLPEYMPVMPIPDEAMPKRAKFFGHELGYPVAEWEYRDADGNLLFFVLRFALKNGNKEYRPYSYCKDRTGFGSWRFKAPQSDRPAYGLDRLAAHPTAKVIFCEGEKSADACQRLIPDCVAVTTMNGAKSPDKTDFRPFAGRRVLIAPDHDEAGDAYKNRLIELLHGVGANVAGFMRVEKLARDGQVLPAGYDLADAEADGWTQDQLDILGGDLWEAIPPPRCAEDGKPQAIGKSKDASAAPADNASKPAQSSFTGKRNPETSASKKKTPQEFAAEFADSRHGGHVAAYCNQVLAYEHGYWKTLNQDVHVKKPLLSMLGIEASAGKVNGVLDLIRILYAVEPEMFEERKPLICLANGTLDPLAGQLLPHSPDYHLTNRLGIDFNPEAKCPLWLQTLEEIFAPDSDKAEKIQLLQEFFGYCMVPDTRFHEFLWLVGAGGNGKSLILAVLTALIGKENISYAQIERLQEKFVRAELQGKLANISSEMSASATVADGYLKQITSGDIIEAERKNEKPFQFKPYARVVGATNTLPRLLDHSDGFFRRAIIVRFNRQFLKEEQDSQREAKLMAELPGILQWALEGLGRLINRGGYVVPASSELELRQYRTNSDPVRQFAEEFLRPTQERSKWISVAELYEHYKAWSANNSYKTLASNQFGERLSGIGVPRERTKTVRLWAVEFVPAWERESAGVSPLASRYSV